MNCDVPLLDGAVDYYVDSTTSEASESNCYASVQLTVHWPRPVVRCSTS
jgi:hypothetical protein